MNPYDHDSIVNFYDERLVDCFVKQNQQNEWLSVVDVASWVFCTNKPTGYQKQYCKNKLVSIKGMMWTSEVEKSFLEQGKAQGCEFLYVYRLKDPSLIVSERQVRTSLEEQVNEVLAMNAG